MDTFADERPLQVVSSFGDGLNLLALYSDRGVHEAEEAILRTIPLVSITFLALLLSPTGARAGGSWCANYGTGHSGIDCSFNSFEQCNATLLGLSGFCAPNPFPGTGYGRGGTWSSPPTDRARRYRAER
ncbi:MAG: DUF3551 domain-containing protein [Hyphomicrobiales bacterium]|nr:DUF3551 domain-containing protein [Hyphomicrobiales bacterium]